MGAYKGLGKLSFSENYACMHMYIYIHMCIYIYIPFNIIYRYMSVLYIYIWNPQFLRRGGKAGVGGGRGLLETSVAAKSLNLQSTLGTK